MSKTSSKNSLQDLGQWGSNLLGQAQTQLAPAAAAATGLASSSLSKGKDLLRKGTSKVQSSLKEGLGGVGVTSGQTHVVQDPREGCSRSVVEVAFIAEGAFGAVVRVADARTGAQYALKKIRCQDGVQVASTFADAEREAKIMTNLPLHPHIVACAGYATEQRPGGGGGTVKLLLELCSGGHLLDFMDSRGGKLSPREILEPFSQIVEAVRHLHAQRPPIQHRDLKVENVLKGADGRWKLCDFGSCSTEVVEPQELPRPRLMKLQEDIDKTVTMLYRPPEMADIELNYRKGYAITERVDLWMLGCVLFTLAFYRHPFQDNATAMAITNAKYFIPGDHEMARSAKLCGIIHWLLAADPKDRPTASKLLEVVGQIGKITYQDLLGLLPSGVREKIRKLDIYAARKDTGDMELPADLTPAGLRRGCSTPATAGGGYAGGAAAGGYAGGGRPQESPQGLSPRPPRSSSATAMTAAAPPPAGPPAGLPAGPPAADEFDLTFALAPAKAPAAAPTATTPAAAAAPAAALAAHVGLAVDIGRSAGGGHEVADLLSPNSPALAPAAAAPAAAPAAASPGLGDLLDFGAAPPGPASALAAAPPPAAGGAQGLAAAAGGAGDAWDAFGAGGFLSAAAPQDPVATDAAGWPTAGPLPGSAPPGGAPPGGPAPAPAQTCGDLFGADFGGGFADFSSAPPPPQRMAEPAKGPQAALQQSSELNLFDF